MGTSTNADPATMAEIGRAIAGGGHKPKKQAAPALNERLLLAADESAAYVGVSLRQFHRMRKELPAPVRLTPQLVRWRRADLDAWAAALLASNEQRTEPAQLAAGKQARRAGLEGEGRAEGPEAATSAGLGTSNL